MAIRIRFDGYPLYAFVPEWMVMGYVLISWSLWYVLKEKYNG